MNFGKTLWISGLGLIALGLIFLAGCAPVRTEVVEVQSTVIVEKLVEIPKEIEVEKMVNESIVVVSQVWDTPAEQEFMLSEIIRPFEKRTSYVVNYQVSPDEALFDQALIQSNTGHVTTDLVIVDQYEMDDWMDAGLVQDVTELKKSWSEHSFVSSFDAFTNREGEQFFLPVRAEMYLLLVNKKALPYLPEGEQVETLTWDGFAQWAVNMAEGEGIGKLVVSGAPRQNWIYQFGSTALSYGAGFPDIDSDAAVEAWRVWAVIGAGRGFIAEVQKVESVVEAMRQEEAWVAVVHCTQVAPIVNFKEQQFLITPLPQGPTGIGSVAGFSGAALMKDAPNQEGAEAFLQYLTSPEVQVKLEKGTSGFVPTVVEAKNYVGSDTQGQVMSAGIQVLEKGILSDTPAADYYDWAAVKQIFSDAFVRVVLNNRGDLNEEALITAAEQLEELRK